jgi:hypothetical protein
MFGNSIQGGFIGNIAGNPFGSGFLIPQQSPSEADRLFDMAWTIQKVEKNKTEYTTCT